MLSPVRSNLMVAIAVIRAQQVNYKLERIVSMYYQLFRSLKYLYSYLYLHQQCKVRQIHVYLTVTCMMVLTCGTPFIMSTTKPQWLHFVAKFVQHLLLSCHVTVGAVCVPAATISAIALLIQCMYSHYCTFIAIA